MSRIRRARRRIRRSCRRIRRRRVFAIAFAGVFAVPVGVFAVVAYPPLEKAYPLFLKAYPPYIWDLAWTSFESLLPPSFIEL